jgi:hypothetical protein
MRIRTILAAAAAPAALAAVLLGTAGQASAAVKPPATITCGDTSQATDVGGQVMSGLVDGNLIVPAGTYCSLQYAEVTGNVSVQGKLSAAATTFDKNVNVSGPRSGLQLFNNPSEIKGNLTITGSSGYANNNYYGGGTSFFSNAVQGGGNPVIDGNFTFTGNTGDLNASYPLTVKGNFTATGNTYEMPWEFNIGGLQATHTSVS